MFVFKNKFPGRWTNTRSYNINQLHIDQPDISVRLCKCYTQLSQDTSMHSMQKKKILLYYEYFFYSFLGI